MTKTRASRRTRGAHTSITTFGSGSPAELTSERDAALRMMLVERVLTGFQSEQAARLKH
jgi:hypothetical protein